MTGATHVRSDWTGRSRGTAGGLRNRLRATDQGGPPYKFVIVLSFKGEPDVKIHWFNSRQFKPNQGANDFMHNLGDPRWNLKRNGDRVVVYGYDDVPIQKLFVEGGGPKPVVRPVLVLPRGKK
jgi:hypothetical protein